MRTQWVWLACAAAALAGALSTPASLAPPGGDGVAPGLAASAAPVSPGLTVDPSSWELEGSNETSLAAVWTAPPAGCWLEPEWYRWAFSSPQVSGTLNATSGAEVTFSATPATPGISTLTVRSESELICGSSARLELATAFSNVSVEAALSLTDLAIDPAPLTPGEPSVLTGSVEGGTPPYELGVNWTDGTRTESTLPGSGAFSIAHTYGAGTFDPLVSVQDSNGLLADATVPESLDVSSAVAVAIDPARTVTDVNEPVEWNATVDRAGDLFVTTPECDGVPGVPIGFSDATAGSCTFTSVGRGSISIDVGTTFEQSLASATSTEIVVPTPSVVVMPPAAPFEVGRGADLVANVTGGVPPFTVDCVGPESPSPYRLVLDSDGPVAIPLVPTVAGDLEFVVQVVDADGVASAPATAELEVATPLNVTVGFGRTVIGAGVSLSAAGTVASGAAPFQWIVAPEGDAPGPGPAAGLLAAPGSFNWSELIRLDGAVAVAVVVVDGAGAVVSANRTIEAAPLLSVLATVDANLSGAPDVLEVSVDITGGLPPFNLTFVATPGPTWNSSAVTDGPATARLAVPNGGAFVLTVVVRDATGATDTDNASVDLPTPAGPPTAASGNSTAAIVGGLVAMGVAIGGCWAWLRRRPQQPETATPDPVSVLRGIIEPADGADRATVELLAEEGGLSLATARSTLDRLIADGCVRSEVDEDGSEVVAWERDPVR
jgi:hypothetical protein